ncbi:hypothetical protein [Tabrizicola sp.]|uniref:hypothetical protein n=1 Tax=Tabrizicola sp. TaxID=2005166 RepID=UPI002605827C|nr:hypothetical protein [Tabrizicola sp.]MDM7932357.1 hypothetical protein [Tabrizicola sp.]
MSLLALFFGRKGQRGVVDLSGLPVEKVEAEAGTKAISGRVPDLDRTDGIAKVVSAEDAAKVLGDIPSDHAPDDDQTGISAVVVGRFSTLMLSGEAPVGERQAIVLRRLGVVHDPNEVTLSGMDRSARLVVANRRLLSARFNLPDCDEQVFDFRHDSASVDPAIGCMRALSALFEAPVDLLIAEKPFSGVFSGAGGFAIEDASFDEEACREAFEAAMQLPDDFDTPDLLLDFLQSSESGLPAIEPEQVLFETSETVAEPAFAETAAVFAAESHEPAKA